MWYGLQNKRPLAISTKRLEFFWENIFSQNYKKMALSPEEIEQYQTCDIALVRKALKESNMKRTFQRSKELDKIIKSRSSTNYDQAINESLQKLDKDLDDTFSRHEESIEQIDDEYKNKENLLRLTIDDSFAELKERQLQSLVDIEVQKESELIRENKRETSTVYQLRLLATRYADQGDFDNAMKIDEEADQIHKQEVLQQSEKTIKSYDKRKNQLLTQFGTEIDVLESRLKKGLLALQNQRNTEIVNQQKTTAALVQRQLLAAINETNKKVKKIEMQSDITNKLTNFVRNKASEKGMNRKLQYD